MKSALLAITAILGITHVSADSFEQRLQGTLKDAPLLDAPRGFENRAYFSNAPQLILDCFSRRKEFKLSLEVEEMFKDSPEFFQLQ